MKSPDEIKKAAACCVIGPSAHQPKCGECPYMYEKNCSDEFLKDNLAYIQQLEERCKHMNDLRDAAAGRALKMEERVHQLEAERDALMDYLRSMGCDTCLHDNYDAPDSPCNDCTAMRDMWVFEGVQKEDSNA